MVLYKDNFKDARQLTTKGNFRHQYAEGQGTSPIETHHKDSRSNKKKTKPNLKISISCCVFEIILLCIFWI